MKGTKRMRVEVVQHPDGKMFVHKSAWEDGKGGKGSVQRLGGKI